MKKYYSLSLKKVCWIAILNLISTISGYSEDLLPVTCHCDASLAKIRNNPYGSFKDEHIMDELRKATNATFAWTLEEFLSEQNKKRDHHYYNANLECIGLRSYRYALFKIEKKIPFLQPRFDIPISIGVKEYHLAIRIYPNEPYYGRLTDPAANNNKIDDLLDALAKNECADIVSRGWISIGEWNKLLTYEEAEIDYKPYLRITNDYNFRSRIVNNQNNHEYFKGSASVGATNNSPLNAPLEYYLSQEAITNILNQYNFPFNKAINGLKGSNTPTYIEFKSNTYEQPDQNTGELKLNDIILVKPSSPNQIFVDNDEGIRYITDDERENFARILDKIERKFRNMQGTYVYSFVHACNKKFYFFKKGDPQYNYVHTSILNACALISAGDIWIKNGKIEKINNQSGHYVPPCEALERTIDYLSFLGVNDLIKVGNNNVGICTYQIANFNSNDYPNNPLKIGISPNPTTDQTATISISDDDESNINKKFVLRDAIGRLISENEYNLSLINDSPAYKEYKLYLKELQGAFIIYLMRKAHCQLKKLL